jgi:hypothetical protein
MAPRLELQTKLEDLLGSENVYFQPPAGYQMTYPCIVYKRSNIRSKPADNAPYLRVNQYTVTCIDADPDSETPDKVSKLSQCVFDRYFTSENLNHNIFTLLF